MPKLGDTKYDDHRSKYIYHACIDCGKAKWVFIRHGKPEHERCQSCKTKGERHWNWGGGRHINSHGYVVIQINANDPYYSMASKGKVLEHRLVVAKALGRCLQPWEIVHHKGVKYPAGSKEDKQDNRYPENLKLMGKYRHQSLTILETRVDRLENKVKEQDKEIRLLKWRLKESLVGEYNGR